MTRRLPYLILLLIGLSVCAPPKGPTTLALFTPRAENDAFWGPVETVMREACQDLGMELVVYYAEGNRHRLAEQIKEAAQDGTVEALVFPNFKKAGEQYLSIATENETPAFVFNAGLDGTPRETSPYWVGELIPNDEQAGFRLANVLIDDAIAAGKTNADGIVEMVGINGVVTDEAAIERLQGLQRAVDSRDDVLLHEVLPAEWKQGQAQIYFNELYNRHPEITVVWAASDLMALGVIDGMTRRELTPNVDVFTGGIDWSTAGLTSVAKGEMTATIGGHFMDGAWAAVLLYDYFNGVDFAGEGVEMKSEMHVVKQEDAKLYLQRLTTKTWQDIDFTQFSKKLNPERTAYQFDLVDVIEKR